MSAKDHEVNLTLGVSRKSLEAIRIYACRWCGAPGLYKDDEHNKTYWPGCYSPEKAGQMVGDVCPNCGSSRIADLNLGELTASMPKWTWNIVLGFKWCLIKVLTFKKRLTALAQKEK